MSHRGCRQVNSRGIDQWRDRCAGSRTSAHRRRGLGRRRV